MPHDGGGRRCWCSFWSYWLPGRDRWRADRVSCRPFRASDPPGAWSQARLPGAEAASSLVGTSKMQSALDPTRSVSEALGGETVVQLALIDRLPAAGTGGPRVADPGFPWPRWSSTWHRVIFFDGTGEPGCRRPGQILAS